MTLPPPPPPAAASACYRHPDRDAGRRCTRCGKPACGECLVQASVGSHCIDCAKASQPDARTRARYWSARQPALVTMAIIATNVAVFIYLVARDPAALGGSATIGHWQLGLFEQALGDGAAVRLADGSLYITEGGQWYRLVTAGFIHFGVIHLGLNMYLLFILGQMLEPAIGRVRFGLVYFAGILGGSAGSLWLDGGGIAGGASGAVFALMALAFVGYYLNGANPLQTSIGALLMLNLLITFMIPNISIGGHLGGAAAGAACAVAVMAPPNRRMPAWAGIAGPVAVGIVSIVIAVVAV